MPTHLQVEDQGRYFTLQLLSEDGTNRLTRACMGELNEALLALRRNRKPLIISGNAKFFSAGADLAEIRALTGPSAFAFASMGQNALNAIAHFPAPVFAAIHGLLHGRWARSGIGVSPAHRLATCHLRSSRRCPGTRDRLGRNATPAEVSWERASPGDVSRRRKTSRQRWTGDRLDRWHRRRSAGRGGATDRNARDIRHAHRRHRKWNPVMVSSFPAICRQNCILMKEPAFAPPRSGGLP